QEIMLDSFEKVSRTVAFTRGLFGKKPAPAYIDSLLKSLSLGDKANAMSQELSGGMRRRVLIAKALAHEPRVLFLDEPTAGVDVELRRDMWAVVEDLRKSGVTIILTTHYIEEAEAIADRIAVINNGRIMLVEEKDKLMARMGQKELRVDLSEPISALPEALASYDLELDPAGTRLTYRFDKSAKRTGITRLLNDLQKEGFMLADLQTYQSSLEDIFVDLVRQEAVESR
ncbi:MAG: ABC transporter ATP-binding protein, partial [Pseudomonadota bacterium]